MANSIHKISLTFMVLAVLAALCPAPVNDAAAKRLAPTPEQSQEQLAAQQKLNGVMPVVGEVPQKVNETNAATNLPTSNDPSAAGALSVGSNRADNVGNRAIQAATERVSKEKKPTFFPFLLLAILCGIGFGVMRFAQRWLDTNVPMPEQATTKTKRTYY